MATYRRFEELPVWQKARILAKDVWTISTQHPLSRDFKLRDQILSSSGSIMDNIAEGFERNGNKEFINFLTIAKGSCGETRSQLYRSFDREYISEDILKAQAAQSEIISSEIQNMIGYLQKSGYRGQKFNP
jgi:four helix bundle protein